jgi:heat shock 70kDa protein 4
MLPNKIPLLVRFPCTHWSDPIASPSTKGQSLSQGTLIARPTPSSNFWCVSDLSPDQIHFVELVGDCSRTPIVQAVIKQIFEKQELQRTLNSLECIARGASLNSAMMTPNFSVQQFTMNDYNNLPVTVNYQFTDPLTNEAKEPKSYPKIFALGQKFPLVQQLKFDNKEGQLTMSINYDESADLMTGLPGSIAQYDISRGKRSKADVPGSTVKLAIRIKNNINQIPELEKVELTENWTEEEKIPVKTAAKPAAPK